MGEHDTLFKRMFCVPRHAAAELASVLPKEILATVDLSQLELVPGSFVDEAMRERHTDLLFRAPRWRHQAGQDPFVYFYFLFEHLSNPDALAAFRMLQYEVDIWRGLLREDPSRKTLPPIIALVVHHGPGGWRGARSVHEMIEGLEELPALRPFLPNLELLIDDLALASNTDLLERPLAPIPKVAVWMLRDGRDAEKLLAQVRTWGPTLELAAEEEPRELRVVLRYLATVAGPEVWRRVQNLIPEHAPSLEAHMISFFDHVIEQGREQGIQQGLEQGIQQGQVVALRDTLRGVLRERFGEATAALDARIDSLTTEALQRGILRAVSAASAEDVFNGL